MCIIKISYVARNIIEISFLARNLVKLKAEATGACLGLNFDITPFLSKI